MMWTAAEHNGSTQTPVLAGPPSPGMVWFPPVPRKAGATSIARISDPPDSNPGLGVKLRADWLPTTNPTCLDEGVYAKVVWFPYRIAIWKST